MNQLINSNQLTMSSREIAELTGKEHQHVKRDIRTMMEALKLDASNFGCIYLDSLNREQTEYKLDQDLTMTLITGYSVELRHKINIRWRELETSNKTAIPQTYAAALLEAGRLALEVEKQAEQLAIAAPKVKIVDEYMNRESLQNATQVAQTFKMSAVKMNRVLDEIGGIYNKSIKRGRAFCQSFIDN